MESDLRIVAIVLPTQHQSLPVVDNSKLGRTVLQLFELITMYIILVPIGDFHYALAPF
jgi:hypothetical protein